EVVVERPYRYARAALLLLSFFLMAGEVTLRDGFELGDSVEYANEAWRTVHGTAPYTWIARPKRPPLFRLLLCPPLAASLAAHTAGLVLAVLALGVHDWLAAGRFLDSLWVMLGSDVADLTRDAASTWGASPWYDYALSCGSWLELTGPVALAIGAWRAWRDL